MTTLSKEISALVAGRLPRLLPPFIADAIAQDQHRIHVGAFPSHPRSFQTCFDNELVGTLNHPGTDRPTSASKGGILHQREALAYIPQMLSHVFLLRFGLG